MLDVWIKNISVKWGHFVTSIGLVEGSDWLKLHLGKADSYIHLVWHALYDYIQLGVPDSCSLSCMHTLYTRT